MGYRVSKRYNRDGSITKTITVSRKTVFGNRKTQTYSQRIQPKSARSKGKLPWWVWVILILVVIGLVNGGSGNKKSDNSTANKNTIKAATAVTEKPADVASVEKNADTKNETSVAATDEMKALQSFYDEFSAIGTADNLKDLANKYGLFTDFRSNGIGQDHYKVAYTRKLAQVISNDDLKTAGNYVVITINRLDHDKIEELRFHKDSEK